MKMSFACCHGNRADNLAWYLVWHLSRIKWPVDLQASCFVQTDFKAGIKCLEQIFKCGVIKLSDGSDDPGLKVEQIVWRQNGNSDLS